MQEPVSGLIEGHEVVQHGVPALHKPGIVQGDAQLAQGHDHLHNALRVGGTPGGEAAVRALLFRHTGQRLFCGFGHGRLVLILCQGLQRHAGDVRIGYAVPGAGGLCSAEQAPAAVRELALQNAVDIHLPGGLRLSLRIYRHGIIPGIQGNERPDGAVEPLPDGLVVVPQGLGQVIAGHAAGVFSNSAEGHNDAAVFGVFLVVEFALAGSDIRFHGGVVVLIVFLRYGIAAPDQAQHGPFPADGAHLRAFHRLINVLRRVLDGRR